LLDLLGRAGRTSVSDEKRCDGRHF
jgi:hypothetical protein